jgi:hypothetical protein
MSVRSLGSKRLLLTAVRTLPHLGKGSRYEGCALDDVNGMHCRGVPAGQSQLRDSSIVQTFSTIG